MYTCANVEEYLVGEDIHKNANNTRKIVVATP